MALPWEGDPDDDVSISLSPVTGSLRAFSAGRCLSSPSRGSVEKEAWQRRVKISGFLPFAVTRTRSPPLQQHEELAVGVMEE